MSLAEALALLASQARQQGHRDEEYVGDHWATGRCPQCLKEIAEGTRDPRYGGYTIAENQGYALRYAAAPKTETG